MGANSSKPASGTTSYSWKGSGPTSMSQDMMESFQSSNETDASRAQTLELHIQARVAEELRKVQEQEAAALKAVQDKFSAAAPDADEAAAKSPTRETVSREVAALRKKLEGRRQVRELPESVESARSEVVRCLRENDRRPLDCWREVEAFKEEVRRLERTWVDKVVS